MAGPPSNWSGLTRAPVDIVITDLGMAEMDGYELARILHAERPDLPILYMSGYGDTDTVHPLLRKPFSPDVLVHKVEEMLREERVRVTEP